MNLVCRSFISVSVRIRNLDPNFLHCLAHFRMDVLYFARIHIIVDHTFNQISSEVDSMLSVRNVFLDKRPDFNEKLAA